MPGVTLVTACWNGYWDRYGKQWVESVQQLNTAPDEILVATDRPICLPDGWKQKPAVKPYVFDAWNDVIGSASNEWVAFLSMDDLLPVDALDNLVLGGDVVVCGMKDSVGNVSVPDPARYENIFTDPGYPLTGWLIYRRDFHVRHPFRRTNYTDWVAALEYRHHNADIRFDPTIRYLYSIHPEQLSAVSGIKQVDFMKQLLTCHSVVPGPEWPPIITANPSGQLH